MPDKYDHLRHNGLQRKLKAEKKFKADMKRVLALIISFRGPRTQKGFVRISSKLLKKKFPSYQKIIRQLEEEGKIEVLRQFEVGKLAYGYRSMVTPEEEAKILKWHRKYNKPDGEYFGELAKVSRPNIEEAIKLINEHTSVEAISKRAKRVYVEDGVVKMNGNEVKRDFFALTYMGSGKTYYYGKEKFAKVVDQIKVYYFRNKYYAGNSFIEDKSREIHATWLQKVIAMEEGHYIYKSSMKNGRTFNNLTLMPKPLLTLYKYNNEDLINIDGISYQATLAKHLPYLINSIPLLSIYCSFLLTIPPIVRGAFAEAVDSGGFYEEIMRILASRGREITRDEAKKIFFMSIFSKNFDNEWGHLLNVFDPEMKKQIDDFKHMFGYNHYAIALQRAESGIWSQVKKQLEDMGIFHIGKHDAVLVPRSQWEAALKVVIDTHTNYIDKFHISVEGPELNLIYNQDYEIKAA